MTIDNGCISVSIGSTNPEKIKGVRKAIQDFYQPRCININSLNIDLEVQQPIGFNSLIKLAKTRAYKACSHYMESDLCVGVEGGIVRIAGYVFNVNSVAVLRDGFFYLGFSPMFVLPDKLVRYVEDMGLELEKAVERVYNISNIGSRGGLISLLSRKVIDREMLIYIATVMALSSMMHH